MQDQPIHPTPRKSELRTLVLAATVATLAAYAIPHHAAPAGASASFEPGSVIRLEAADSAPLSLDVPSAGILTVDAVTTRLDLAAEILLLTAGDGWSPDRVTVLERSSTHLAAAVLGPGRLELRVHSQDPTSATASLKIVSSFTPAAVIEDIFSPSAAEVAGTRVVRSRFYSLDGSNKGDAEPVDPDPGLTAGSGSGRLLASVTTWRTDVAALKGDAEPVDPDPGLRSNGLELRSQVLFYQGVCGAAAQAGEADDHADLIACATALLPGGPVAGEIANPFGDDGDVFSIVLDEAAAVEIATAGDTDTFGELLDRAGRVLAADDDEGGERNFRLVRTLPPGHYFVRVRGAAGAEGPYELSLATGGR